MTSKKVNPSVDEEDNEKVYKKDPFLFVNSINEKSSYIYDDETKVKYNQFMINKAFSYYRDTVNIANHLNMYPPRDDKWHYDFLFYAVDQKKRWAKWGKKEIADDLVLAVVEYMELSIKEAIFYLSVLSEEEKEDLKESLQTGGRK